MRRFWNLSIAALLLLGGMSTAAQASPDAKGWDGPGWYFYSPPSESARLGQLVLGPLLIKKPVST